MDSYQDQWVDKYRPKSLDDYVFQNKGQKAQIQKWVDGDVLPHLLFSGIQGTGKTTLARILVEAVEVHEYDLMEINASKENDVKTFREKISNFAQIFPHGKMKYIILDEADQITPAAQNILKADMETYAPVCRFILTTNHPNKIIPPLHSRCQGFHIDKLELKEFTANIAKILLAEGVQFDLDTLDTYVRAKYPDLRKAINLVQQHSVDGKLEEVSVDVSNSNDWLVEAINLFKAGKYKEARTQIVSKARPDEYDDVFRFMYQNLELWGATEALQDQAIIIIRNGAVKHTMVADPEINLAATLIELTLNATS